MTDSCFWVGTRHDTGSVISLYDSDEEDDSSSKGLCITQLELNIVTKRREHFAKAHPKTYPLLQQLIGHEMSMLRTILARHRSVDDSLADHLPFVINAKRLVAGLCLDLIVNQPVETKLWNQYENFCEEFNHEGKELRDEMFELLLAKDIPSVVYCQMCYCEHNLSGDYFKARGYITRGIEKHKNCLELYTTRLTLEMGECYVKRLEFVPDKTYDLAEKDILFGNDLTKTYTAICSNFDLKERHVIEALDKVLYSSCREYPCFPVNRLNQNFCRDWKEMCPKRAVTEVISLEADIQLNAVNENNAGQTLVTVFQMFWNSYQSENFNPKILHRALETFRSMDLNSTTVRQFVYLILDIGLYYKCLTPEHVMFYFKQLSLENSAAADSKTKTIFNITKTIFSTNEPSLRNSLSLWEVRFITVLRLSNSEGNKDIILNKLMHLALEQLGKTKNLLTLFGGLFSRLILKSNGAHVVLMKMMFRFLRQQPREVSTLGQDLQRMYIMWLHASRRLVAAKTEYKKLKLWYYSETPENSTLHLDLLGKLFFDPVKEEAECKSNILTTYD